MSDRYREYRGIKKLSSGLYLVRIRTIDPRTGKEVSKTQRVEARTIEGAVAARRALLSKVTSGGEPIERKRLKSFCASWLSRKKATVRPSTQSKYTIAIEVIIAGLGDFYVDAIRPGDVEDWIALLVRQGYAAATVNSLLGVLRAISKAAVRDCAIPSFVEGVRPLGQTPTKGARAASLTPDELSKVLTSLWECVNSGSVAASTARAIETLAWTGIRFGELAALTWADHEGGALIIRRAVWHHHEGPTKSAYERRVAVIPWLASVLEEQRSWLLREQHPGLESGLIFPASPIGAQIGATRRGTDELLWHLDARAVNRALRLACAKAGLERASAHALRRTYEDSLRLAGVTDLVRRSMAGWTTGSMQAHYATVRDEEQAAAGASLAMLFSGRYLAAEKSAEKTTAAGGAGNVVSEGK